ncbi:MAG TPA: glycosyltransferase [Gemmataceae bacterium]|jgi:glycosyltransferase involved in cell wall biosynthesis|nr:glycosyltransferase [Gemmataceae bacterium]
MLRVLHGPVNVGNHPWVLSRHERRLGIHSDLVINYSTWLGYSADRCLKDASQGAIRNAARHWLFALSAPFRYDVLHYYFGQSFLSWNNSTRCRQLFSFADLKLARRLGRKIFMTLQGCDVRLSDRSAARNAFTPCHQGRCQAVPVCRASLDRRRRHLIEHILPAVDRVFVLNPELYHYVPGSVFLPYASVDVEAFIPAWPKEGGTAVVLHAPTDESIKGSGLIIEAVERLKKRIPLEFVLVKGVSHQEALALYRRADLVIDQVLAGWYGGFAVEAMAMGKPVACYIRQEDLGCVPPAMRAELPVIRLTPATVEADLEAALLQRDRWPQWGRRARDFVLRWHHPRGLAAAMIAAYQDPGSHFDLNGGQASCAA